MLWRKGRAPPWQGSPPGKPGHCHCLRRHHHRHQQQHWIKNKNEEKNKTRLPTEKGKKWGVSLKPVFSLLRNLRRRFETVIISETHINVWDNWNIFWGDFKELYWVALEPLWSKVVWFLPKLWIHVGRHEVGSDAGSLEDENQNNDSTRDKMLTFPSGIL